MSCYLTQQKYEKRQKMVQLSMLLKLLKNRVIILAFVIMLDHVEDKVLPFSCVQRRKSTKGYTTHCNWAR